MEEPIIVEPKRVVASKTAWFNFGLIVLGIVELLEQTDLSGFIPNEYHGLFLVFIGIIGILLRFVTHGPIALGALK